METIWAVSTVIAVLLVFCLYKAYTMGYKAGARRVLVEWKKTLNDMGEEE